MVPRRSHLIEFKVSKVSMVAIFSHQLYPALPYWFHCMTMALFKALATRLGNVAVVPWALSLENGNRVTVTVVSGTETVTLEGFRGNL